MSHPSRSTRAKEAKDAYMRTDWRVRVPPAKGSVFDPFHTAQSHLVSTIGGEHGVALRQMHTKEQALYLLQLMQEGRWGDWLRCEGQIACRRPSGAGIVSSSHSSQSGTRRQTPNTMAAAAATTAGSSSRPGLLSGGGALRKSASASALAGGGGGGGGGARGGRAASVRAGGGVSAGGGESCAAAASFEEKEKEKEEHAKEEEEEEEEQEAGSIFGTEGSAEWGRDEGRRGLARSASAASTVLAADNTPSTHEARPRRWRKQQQQQQDDEEQQQQQQYNEERDRRGGGGGGGGGGDEDEEESMVVESDPSSLGHPLSLPSWHPNLINSKRPRVQETFQRFAPAARRVASVARLWDKCVGEPKRISERAKQARERRELAAVVLTGPSLPLHRDRLRLPARSPNAISAPARRLNESEADWRVGGCFPSASCRRQQAQAAAAAAEAEDQDEWVSEGDYSGTGASQSELDAMLEETTEEDEYTTTLAAGGEAVALFVGKKASQGRQASQSGSSNPLISVEDGGDGQLRLAPKVGKARLRQLTNNMIAERSLVRSMRSSPGGPRRSSPTSPKPSRRSSPQVKTKVSPRMVHHHSEVESQFALSKKGADATATTTAAEAGRKWFTEKVSDNHQRLSVDDHAARSQHHHGHREQVSDADPTALL